jgi:protein-tyrosine phosphatase
MEELILQNKTLIQELKQKNAMLDFLQKENMDLKDQLLLLTSEDDDVSYYHYTMITSTIAIGDCDSSYNNFDVVIDISHPAFTNSLVTKSIKQNDHFGKKVIVIQLQDHETKEEEMYDVLTELIPLVREMVKTTQTKILFHCFAGVSRSATLGIVWIAVTHHLSYDEAYQIVKMARPIIHPNKGFVRAAKRYIKDTMPIRK